MQIDIVGPVLLIPIPFFACFLGKKQRREEESKAFWKVESANGFVRYIIFM